MVHIYLYTPGDVPKIAVEGELGASMVVLSPLTCDQVPIPTVGVLAVICTLPLQAVSWLAPAMEVVGTAYVVTLTISELVPQFPFATFHCKRYTPGIILLKVDVAEFTFEKAAVDPDGELRIVHVPVPTPGTVAAMVVLVAPQNT
jgi:hypothetical protein